MSQSKICTHIKDDGTPCQAFPVNGSPNCYFHRKYYNPPALPGDKNFQPPLLESHESIQLALTHLYQAYLAHKIDQKEANFGLQVLRLASKTITTIEKAKTKAEADRKQAQDEAEKKEVREELARRLDAIILGRGRPAPARIPDAEPEPKRGVYDPYGCLSHLTEAEPGGK